MLADTVQTLTDRARAELGEHRFLHLLGVTHTVAVLAAVHGLGLERAAVAGLLHDLSKPLEPAAIERDLADWGVAIPKEDRPHPRTWHGLHAAEWARRALNLDEAEVLEAVTLHTTADAGVGPLTQALFVADFTEPTRRTAAAPQILALARADLAAGFVEALRAKTAHVRAKGRPLHVRAQRALREHLSPREVDELLAVGG